VRVLTITLILTLSLAAAHAEPFDCRGDQRQIAALWFGRKVGDRLAVTEAMWNRFVDREITPKFPDGLTIVDARGQWRDIERNKIVREPSKFVTIVLSGRDGDNERLQQVIEAYKRQFRQQSVALEVRPACVHF
jgi:Protein of unknown function (DUF3574)